ncbi:MAG: enoyl-CoA hydratase-related protein [Candidatus Lernaella stagnicola]|nr:enoyl-CoA hydratase-related protein [Candidatus Lernaella stagnicola]
MAYKNILLEIEAGVAVVIINRPHALNALNSATIKELQSAFDKIIKDKAVRAVVLTGAGEKAFVAGADISEMAKYNPLKANLFAALGQQLTLTIENCPKPVIAAVNGFALGGGTELAMACDFIYASANAKFGQPEIMLGIIPGFGGTQRLPRLVGKARAKELVLTGDRIDAEEARRIGLINKIFPAEMLLDEAKKTARRIAAFSRPAVQAAIDAINKGVDVDLPNALFLERQAFAILCSTKDQKEGMKAFLEKRKPDFKDK